MRITVRLFPRNIGGYALAVTMVFLAIMLTVLASINRLTYTQATLTARNNLYNSTVAAAEAASEMAIAQMDRDFIYQSVNPDLDVYRNLTPESLQGDWPLQFEFSDGQGGDSVTGVESLGPTMMTNLNSQFAGLYGMVSPYRITSTARPQNRLYDMSATVSQEIQLAAIPVFQFAIFYTLDLEVNPGPKMVITGKVHSNGDIFTAPGTGLDYKDYVTSAGRIYNDRHPDDPQYGSAKVKPNYSKDHTEKISALTLPIGEDNTPSSVHKILEPPPAGENASSLLGRQRYYNKADLIVTTTSTGVTLSAGSWDLFKNIPHDVTNAAGVKSYSFIKTDTSFRDAREGKQTTTTQIDVAALKTWLADPKKGLPVNSSADYAMGHEINSIYVDDRRVTGTTLTCVRVVNGSSLPNDGLSVITPLPLYVKGHFNLNNGDTTVGQLDTSKTKPASLVGDAITVLSQNYDDSYTGNTVESGRNAANTTVNAAFLAGIVTTKKVGNNKYYSGGVENFPRLLEHWGDKTLTYNGSMVVMFESQYATKFWQGPAVKSYYVAPTRKWAFDINFLNHAKLPPGTPQVKKLVRGQWVILTPPN